MSIFVGDHFSQWEVVSFSNVDKKYRKYYSCVCTCGKTSLVRDEYLKRGLSTRCKSCASGDKNKSHSLSKHFLYPVWNSMMSRCYNGKCESYKYYGGRGIIVCDEWKRGPIVFLQDMETSYQIGLTLERIDVNGNYCKENCKWATWSEQRLNQRNSLKNKEVA